MMKKMMNERRTLIPLRIAEWNKKENQTGMKAYSFHSYNVMIAIEWISDNRSPCN